MQANDFENEIKSQLDEFTLVPKEEVWELVAARIAKEKKRRGLTFWFFTFSFVAIGFITWGIVEYNGKKEMIDFSPALSIINDPNPNAIASLVHSDNNIDQPLEKLPEETEINAGKKTQSIKKEKIAGETRNNKSHHNNQGRNSFLIKAYNKQNQIKALAIHEKISNAAKIVETQRKHEVVQKSGFLNLKQQNTITNEPKDSSSNVNPVSKEALKKQLLSNANSKNKSAQAKTSKNGWKAGITAFAGISNNQPGINLGGKKADRYSAQVNTTGGLSSTNQKVDYAGAFSFGVGLFITKRLTDKINFSIGGDYHFYQAISKVGSKYNGILNAIGPTSLNQSIVTEYYSFGNSNRFSNKYHLVEMPIQLSFGLYKQKKIPVTITTSLIPGYLFGSSALYANANSNAYYVEKEQFRQFQLSAAAGLMFTIKNKFRSRLSFGPVFQYNLTNMTKGYLQSDQHLLFGGIKTNFILK